MAIKILSHLAQILTCKKEVHMEADIVTLVMWNTCMLYEYLCYNYTFLTMVWFEQLL